jgi:triacylglycerol esterase/lipase EstA (alpha/beta hydrolase family)
LTLASDAVTLTLVSTLPLVVLIAFALLFLGCVGYVVVSYTIAFGLRPIVGERPRVLRAAFAELLACLILLPFYPLWLLIGASYAAGMEGEGTARGRRNPVILLHGFAMNRTSWVWLGSRLAARGLGPLYGTSYFSPQSVPVSARHLGNFVERVLAREDATQVDIVAHSLGGVVARYYIERMGGDRRVGRLVTIASPHQGTLLGRLGMMTSTRQIHHQSPFLTDLGTPKPGVAYTSVWSRSDAIVIPAESASIAPAGEDRVFDGLGHLSLLMSPRVLDVVAERLAT